ncbi:tRNA-uridine aminocarboxypropyltransferase [Arcobacter sp. YIC-464]|uniref:tRNA-uridine aminocarboxypropyltransferase n=1 Tax=Arcobacter sp. YIC-464 TaxID=3376631 RepID=UPI003C2703E9
MNKELKKCYNCYRPKTSCSCENIKEKINTNTKFIILMHPKEFKKTKNGTGFMTRNSIYDSEVIIGIDFTNNKRVNELINNKNYNPYLLYPHENSIKVNKELISNNKQLLIFILDSTWPCSKKMLKLSSNLQQLPKLSFEHDLKSNFQFKTQPQDYCLSTIESTFCLLQELNKQNIENIKENDLNSFLSPFHKMVEYQVNCKKLHNN